MERSSRNTRVFWGVILVILATDVTTKWMAASSLALQRPREVLGDAVRLTLVYNPGAAFGLNLGPYSRWIFMALTLGALAILWRLYRSTRTGDWVRVLALGLVCGGAVGNLVDRVRSAIGVVDFIDVGFADYRWPTFNVADMAVSTGAFLLAWVLWGEDHQAQAAEVAVAAGPGPTAAAGETRTADGHG
jgi:signal peptidase II